MLTSVLWAAGGTGFACLMTALGAGTVFLFRRTFFYGVQKLFFGFAAGVMIAASVWSLIIPAVEHAQAQGLLGWPQTAGGFLLGVCFVIVLDKTLCRNLFERNAQLLPAGARRSFLLISAVTLHNIPEGMAVGLSFALACLNPSDPLALAAAIALALGIGIQNFPEGAAISLPLRQQGFSTRRAFVWGALSGIVEPLFGVLTVLAVSAVDVLLPWLLAFAAGAMMYVVVAELLPQTTEDQEDPILTTCATLTGFMLMMILDIALG